MSSLFEKLPEEQTITFEMLPISEKANIITQTKQKEAPIENEDAKKSEQTKPKEEKPKDLPKEEEAKEPETKPVEEKPKIEEKKPIEEKKSEEVKEALPEKKEEKKQVEEVKKTEEKKEEKNPIILSRSLFMSATRTFISCHPEPCGAGSRALRGTTRSPYPTGTP